MSHLPIESTDVFQPFELVANAGWNTVQDWPWFPKSTIGSQLVGALDSICANLSEGDGRYSDAEALHFFTIARASARESQHWIKVAAQRRLMPDGQAGMLVDDLDRGMQMLNRLINYRRRTKNQGFVREEVYGLVAEEFDKNDNPEFPSERRAPNADKHPSHENQPLLHNFGL
jgi:four helix bundle protein